MDKGVVLTVDDDEELQIVLKQYLENDGYKVETASDGAQMLEKITTVDSDVILLDLVLPDTDGLTLLAQVRAKGQVPVIVLSGKNDTTEKIVCLEMGADDYITKPFEMRELSARIKAALRRSEQPAVSNGREVIPDHVPPKEERVEFHGFVIDRNQFQLFDSKNKSLDVTTGEFELLDALVSSPNRALSRERLFELTRDNEYDSYDRAIDIQIGRIRKKLGKAGPDIIKTVRGVGYMFCPASE